MFGCSVLRVSRNVAIAVAISAFMILAAEANEESSTLHTEYGKTISSARSIQAYGSDIFGDWVNLYTGSTEFIITDVSLRGNNALPVSVGRHYKVEDKVGVYPRGGIPTTEQQFSDWSLDIPYLTGIFPQWNWVGKSNRAQWFAALHDSTIEAGTCRAAFNFGHADWSNLVCGWRILAWQFLAHSWQK